MLKTHEFGGSEQQLEEIRQATADDQVLQKIIQLISLGWPNSISELADNVTRIYFQYRDELVCEDGIIFKGQRILIPASLRKKYLAEIHSSHIGIEGCLRRARELIFWPGMNAEVKDLISRCPICLKYRAQQQKEPIIQEQVPDRAWATVSADLFQYRNQHDIVMVDHFSNFVEIATLAKQLSSKNIIQHIKSIFARHGIPEKLITDNGPQFASQDFANFSKEWKFRHTTSSPTYSQSNGKAENAVKTIKSIFNKNQDANHDIYIFSTS